MRQDNEPLKLTSAEIDKLKQILKRLISDDPETRKKAQKELEKFLDNDAKAEWLKKNIDRSNVDLAFRVKEILDAYANE